MRIIGYDYAVKPEAPTAKVERFYVHSVRSWSVVSRDAAGNQIGDATYVYTEGEARREQRERLTAAGLPVRGNMLKTRAVG
jgi:hypothetical protein